MCCKGRRAGRLNRATRETREKERGRRGRERCCASAEEDEEGEGLKQWRVQQPNAAPEGKDHKPVRVHVGKLYVSTCVCVCVRRRSAQGERGERRGGAWER